MLINNLETLKELSELSEEFSEFLSEKFTELISELHELIEKCFKENITNFANEKDLN